MKKPNKKEFNKVDAVFSVKITENVYTLAQHRGNTYFEFFDIFFTKPDNDREIYTNLNKINVLFTISCAANRLKDFFIRLEDSIQPNSRAVDTIYLHPFHYLLSSSQEINENKKCTSLVKLTDIFQTGSTSYDVLIECLDYQEHYDYIYNHSILGMVGNSNKLKFLLKKYIETGVLWGEDKQFLFPTIEPCSQKIPTIYPVNKFYK